MTVKVEIRTSADLAPRVGGVIAVVMGAGDIPVWVMRAGPDVLPTDRPGTWRLEFAVAECPPLHGAFQVALQVDDIDGAVLGVTRSEHTFWVRSGQDARPAGGALSGGRLRRRRHPQLAGGGRRGRRSAGEPVRKRLLRVHGVRSRPRPPTRSRTTCSSSPTGPVLELACGRGDFLDLLRETGVEGPRRRRRRGHGAARRRPRPQGRARRRGGLPGAGQPGSLRRVFCAHFLEHLQPDAVARIYRGAARALRPGGTFVAAVPSAGSLSVLGYDFWRDPTHVRFYDPMLLAFFAGQAGLLVSAAGGNPRNDPGPPPLLYAQEFEPGPTLSSSVTALYEAVDKATRRNGSSRAQSQQAARRWMRRGGTGTRRPNRWSGRGPARRVVVTACARTVGAGRAGADGPAPVRRAAPGVPGAAAQLYPAERGLRGRRRARQGETARPRSPSWSPRRPDRGPEPPRVASRPARRWRLSWSSTTTARTCCHPASKGCGGRTCRPARSRPSWSTTPPGTARSSCSPATSPRCG